MKVEIKKIGNSWSFWVRHEDGIHCGVDAFDSVKKAFEEGSRKLLELIKETFDFGNGPVPAHKHENGGGWVADTAHVDDTVYVGPDARVYGFAKVYDHVRINDQATVYGQAQLHNDVCISNTAQIFNNAIIRNSVSVRHQAKVYGHAQLFNHVTIKDKANISGYIVLRGSVIIAKDVKFDSNLRISGDAEITKV